MMMERGDVMKYLILGSEGMAGHMIACYLKERGHEVTGFARRKSWCCPTIIGDACDEVFLKKIFSDSHFDIVVNAIGILNQTVDRDLEEGIYLNAKFPHIIAELCAVSSSRLIHISTDCVFSGKKGKYREDDISDAQSNYGKTKRDGEVIDDINLTVRTSIVGPELKKDGTGLYHWFMNQKGQISGYRKAFWSGVTTLELAKFIEKVAPVSVTGLYHLSNNKAITKYDLLMLFNKFCHKNFIDIYPVDEPVCDKSLLCTRKDFIYQVPSYQEMIQDMGVWIGSHRSLYKNYEVLL